MRDSLLKAKVQDARLLLSHIRHRSSHASRREAEWFVGPQSDERLHYSFRALTESNSVFVHIPKAAGMSISQALYGCAAVGHRPMSEFRRIYGPALSSMYVFTFVRHPYSRFESAYRFLSSGGHPAFPADRGFGDFIQREFTDIDDFVESWLSIDSAREAAVHHFRPQTDYLTIGGRLLHIDFIGRFENLNEDFAEVARRVGVTRELPHRNQTRGVAGDGARLTPASRAIIRDVYARDFEMLGYGAE